MTNQGPWPSRFVWHNLMSTDVEKSQQFYCSMFDWQINAIPIGPVVYRIIVAGPGAIGGMREEKNIPRSHWLPYVAVPDVDAAAAKAAQLHGKVCVPPTDIPATGRFAVVMDPCGAALAIFTGQPGSHGFDPDLGVPGRVCWNELLSSDDRRAQAFYSGLFGWREQPKDMGPMGTYRIQMLGDKQVGGIMKNPQNGAPDAWLAYFFAPDLAAATAKAKRLGAEACMENVPIPGIGAFSMLIDPAGAVFALFEPQLPADGTC